MTFHKVIELSASRVQVGLTQDSHWVCETRDGRLEDLGKQTQLFMVTILEFKGELAPALVQGLEACGLDPSLAATFPADVGVQLGLTWDSDYWQELAVQWVEREASEKQFLPELQRLAVEGRTQRIRHTARRLARRAT